MAFLIKLVLPKNCVISVSFILLIKTFLGRIFLLFRSSKLLLILFCDLAAKIYNVFK